MPGHLRDQFVRQAVGNGGPRIDGAGRAEVKDRDGWPGCNAWRRKGYRQVRFLAVDHRERGAAVRLNPDVGHEAKSLPVHRLYHRLRSTVIAERSPRRLDSGGQCRVADYLAFP